MKSSLKSLVGVCCVIAVVLTLPALGQKGGGNGGSGSGTPKGGGGVMTGTPGPTVNNGPLGNTANPWFNGMCNTAGTMACLLTTTRPLPATPLQDDVTCFLPPVEGIRSPTVNVRRLEVPERAKHEYEKACSELHHKKYAQAEEHLQKAIDTYSAYTAAWVLLGQVQEQQQKTNDAMESCQRAMRIESGYAPSYLCLAHVFATGRKWSELKDVTDRLLQLHPLNASNGYYYNALAYFHLNNLSSAETSALRGVQDTEKMHQPQLHLLLARIYERKGDRSQEVTELREYLKRDPRGSDVPLVNDTLKTIAHSEMAGRQ